MQAAYIQEAPAAPRGRGLTDWRNNMVNVTFTRCVSTSALISLGAFACDRERSALDEPVTTTPAERLDEDVEPVRGTTPPAVQAITQARCAREQRCNNIGADQKYASQDACLTRVEAEWHDELNTRECPGGVNQGELNECLQEIRNDDCNNPIDTLGRFAACRESDLCNALP